ncbi:UDP-2,3-diacylglucosamine diphosphatase LpxI [Lentibacter algarum]|uniref:LpxI family protein n=1 Tax=Lentibacter algarum TaxID=576131 RepID=UPI001C08E763|nr:UDP-2,3-diacylglucosamine diphosphatase LpxI [Lentibacter algarum]MBU2982477.1 UDP-2,3-diacylglucosamine diphosphatase LpxI [Lentibacter algarum]
MLALIAGRGALPKLIAEAQAEPPLICALEGNNPQVVPDITFRLETLGTLLLELGKRGVTDVCFCGAIDRPAVDPSKLDAETLPLVPIFMQALQKGDDGALRAAMQIFEQTGFKIRAANELLPDLTLAESIPTKAKPEPRHEADALLGETVLVQMGNADLGQACVLRRGEVLARENDAGTDAMLAKFAEEYVPHTQGIPAIDWALGALDWIANPTDQLVDMVWDWFETEPDIDPEKPKAADGAILFKAPKPEQDLRADMPTIGPATAMKAAEAGLDGIVIEAGKVIVVDQVHVLRILDAMGMFLWVRTA